MTTSVAACVVAAPASARATAVPPSATSSPTITGIAVQGQTLTASIGSWAGDTPLAFSYQWEDCGSQGCVAISGATATTYVAQALDIGDTLVVSVTATNDAGTAVATSAPTPVVTAGAPPAPTSQPTPAGTAAPGSTLTIPLGTWSGTAPIAFSYQWQRCTATAPVCADVAGATGPSYLLTAADVGSRLRVTVTASNLVGSYTIESNLSAVVGGPPVGSAPPTISGSPIVGRTLTAQPGAWQGAAPIAYGYQWQRCTGPAPVCATVAGATGSTYTLTSGDVGSRLRAVVTASNPVGSAQGTSALSSTVAPTTPAPTPPLIGTPPVEVSAPPVIGSPRLGGILAAGAGGWDGSGQLRYAYTWQRCTAAAVNCVTVPGATLPTYIPGTADVGATLRVVVTATNPFGSASATSTPIGPIIQVVTPTTDPYRVRTLGVDISFPQCGGARPRVDGFFIVGVNDGLPFTSNPCFRREYAWAKASDTPAAVYLNTSYSRKLLHLITPACRRSAATGGSTRPTRLAYALGCSEASDALGSILAPSPPTVIWLDVEPANRWSPDSALNAAAIRGMLDSLKGLEPTPIVGIYSARSWWQEITGGLFTPTTPEWIPQLASAACAATSFAGGPVWLSQGGNASIDLDRAC